MNNGNIPIVVELRRGQGYQEEASLSIYNITLVEILPLLDQNLKIQHIAILCIDEGGRLMELELSIAMNLKQLQEVLNRNGYNVISIQMSLEKGTYIDTDFSQEIHIYTKRNSVLVDLIQLLLHKLDVTYKVSKVGAFCFAIQNGELIHFGSMNQYLNNNEKYIPKTSVRKKAS